MLWLLCIASIILIIMPILAILVRMTIVMILIVSFHACLWLIAEPSQVIQPAQVADTVIMVVEEGGGYTFPWSPRSDYGFGVSEVSDIVVADYIMYSDLDVESGLVGITGWDLAVGEWLCVDAVPLDQYSGFYILVEVLDISPPKATLKFYKIPYYYDPNMICSVEKTFTLTLGSPLQSTEGSTELTRANCINVEKWTITCSRPTSFVINTDSPQEGLLFTPHVFLDENLTDKIDFPVRFGLFTVFPGTTVFYTRNWKCNDLNIYVAPCGPYGFRNKSKVPTIDISIDVRVNYLAPYVAVWHPLYISGYKILCHCYGDKKASLTITPLPSKYSEGAWEIIEYEGLTYQVRIRTSGSGIPDIFELEYINWSAPPRYFEASDACWDAYRAIQQAESEGRTIGLEEAKAMFQLVIEMAEQGNYDQVVAYAEQTKGLAEHATKPQAQTTTPPPTTPPPTTQPPETTPPQTTLPPTTQPVKTETPQTVPPSPFTSKFNLSIVILLVIAIIFLALNIIKRKKW